MGSQHDLNKLLAARSGALSSLLTASGQHAALLAEVRSRLPAELAAALHGAVLEDGCLRLAVTSGAWAGRLRYLAPQLGRELAQLAAGRVESVQVRVAVDAHPAPPARPPAPRPLSAASRAHLASVAETTDQPRLAAALRALARNGD